MATEAERDHEKIPTRQSAEGSVTTDATSTKDEALALVGEHGHDIDPAIERRVVRKLDLFLLPAMVLGYGLVSHVQKCSGAWHGD